MHCHRLRANTEKYSTGQAKEYSTEQPLQYSLIFANSKQQHNDNGVIDDPRFRVPTMQGYSYRSSDVGVPTEKATTGVGGGSNLMERRVNAYAYFCCSQLLGFRPHHVSISGLPVTSTAVS